MLLRQLQLQDLQLERCQAPPVAPLAGPAPTAFLTASGIAEGCDSGTASPADGGRASIPTDRPR